VNPEGLAELRAYVEELWEDVLGAFQRAAEKASTPEETTTDRRRSTADH
jgi:hypothetical protein